MIDRDEMIQLALDASPSFKPLWDEFLDEWKGEKSLPLYLVLGDLSRHISKLVTAKSDSELKRLFSVVERWHIEGSPYVKEAATIGLLEALQGEENASEIESYLLPETKKWWDKVNDFWNSGKLISD